MTKWVAMADLHGCMPNICEEFDKRENAITFLLEVHEIDTVSLVADELDEHGLADINLSISGNEYLEVIEKEETE